MVRSEKRLRLWLIGWISAACGANGDAIDVTERFNRLGLDSLSALRLVAALSEELGRPLTPTIVWQYPTIEALVRHLTGGEEDPRLKAPAADRALRASEEPIAIIGMACRLPGAPDIEAFWRLLCGGVDAIREVPQDRWDIGALFDEDPRAPGKMSTRWGGFLDCVDGFDPQFFGISPREAVQMDPQQRLALELAWEALEDAGVVAPSLRDSRTAVFFGAMWSDYARVPDEPLRAMTQHTATGLDLSIIPARISYTLGLRGPSVAVNTACSSSLVAVHQARRSLQLGECDLALAGGVSLILSPASTVAMSKFGAMSPDGRCKAFDARANGYVRGEGGGVVVLKRLSRALADGDPIQCVLIGSAVNNDGCSNGLTAPSPRAQELVLEDACRDAGVDPADVRYVEAHGTGTVVGDPIEAGALGAVLGASRPPERPLIVGSVKTNIGHLEAAAGVAGLIKAALIVKRGAIPPSLHYQEPNPRIAFEALRLRVPTCVEAFPAGEGRSLAGVSSFGFGGTNAHVVLEGFPDDRRTAGTEGVIAPCRSAELLVLSAKSAAALDAQAARLSEHLETHAEQGLGDVAFSLATMRSAMEHRLAVAASSREGLRAALTAAAQGQTPPGAVRGRLSTSSVPKVVFVFPGQGSQWLGMGRQLLAEEPIFRAALQACDRAIQAEVGWSLLEELTAEEAASQLDRIDVVQPVLFAMEVGLAALWQSWGVTPDAVVGHSMGEIAAAHVIGVLSLEDAVAIICRWSCLQRRLSGQGEMAVVELSASEAEAALTGYEARLRVGVINSPRSTVLSGEPAALGEVLSRLEAKGVFCRRVKVDVATHSPQMDSLREELLTSLSALRPQAAAVPMHSTVTGAVVRGPELVASYWADNLRLPVRFAEAVQTLLREGHGLFVEMSPHPILTTSVEESRRATAREGAALGSLRRGQDERSALLEALGALWVQGYPVAWERLFPVGGRRVSLPSYPWQRERYWIEPAAASAVGDSRRIRADGPPLLGEVQTLSTQTSTRRREEDDWFLEPTWEPAAVPAPKRSGGRWLLLGGGGGLGRLVRSALEAAGHAVVHATGNDTSAAGMRAVLANAFGGPAPTAVVHLGSLEGGVELNAEALEGALVRGCDSVLGTVQALAAMGYRDAPRLWLVTRGAQAAGAGEVSVAQAPLLGLGRVIALEHAELRCGRIDLDPTHPGGEVEALVAELLADDAEEEVALRGGERSVARLSHRPPELERREKVEAVFDRPFRLEIDEPGVLDRLVLRATERRAPGPGEVEIAVEAAGLNFLDVLLALGVMPNDLPGESGARVGLGGECAGSIVAVGEGVSGLSVGKPVIALTGGAFASHVTTPATLVLPRPLGLSVTEAAAMPVAYLTAWYALDRVARLQPGERVLIHAATGGVGLAAVQWARHVGAEIYATAGTPEKRAYLESLGVRYVSDSRTDRFVADVRAWTGGEGVDVVLNSLSGELIHKSFALLRSYGRFVELGKRDYYADNQLGLRPFLRNLSFSLVDMRAMMLERPARVRALFEDLLGLVAAGVFTPPPIETLPIGQATGAFQKMAQAQHIGKLVLTLADPEVRIRVSAGSSITIRADSTYLVTGGLGGLGLSVAGWLAAQGAGHLVLVGRSGAVSVEQQAAVAALQAQGTRVTVAKADVADRAQLEGVVREVGASGMPLRGVVHAAGLLSDGLLMQQTPGRLRAVMAPKVLGALHLDRLTREAPLDFFVLYASGAGLLGSPSQGNYAAANTFLDALAHHRRRQGLPALSIDWGAFAEVGLAAAQENRGARLASRGMRSLTLEEGLSALGRLLESDRVQVGVVPLDVRQWVELYPAAASSRMLSRLASAQRAGAGRSAGDRDLLERLAVAEPGARAELLREVLRAQVSQVLRLPEGKLDVEAPLTSLGMDSLMGLELRNRIEAVLGITVSATFLWAYPTVAALSGHLAGQAVFVEDGKALSPPDTRKVAPVDHEVAQLDEDGLFALLAESLTRAGKETIA